MAGRSELYFITLILLLAVALLVADRMVRIEGFLDTCKDQRCGIGFQPCKYPLRCMNGVCAPTDPPLLKETDLPVVP
jgi:hypothetical protein